MNNSSRFAPSLTQAAATLFSSARHIIFLAHTKPDADAFGACGALARLALQKGKTIEIIYPKGVMEPYPLTLAHCASGTHEKHPDLVITCDTSDPKRRYFPASFSSVPSIVIDHHLENTIDATVRLVDEQATSTCELVYDLLCTWQEPIDSESAHFLLLGILYDTMTFRTPNVSPHTLAIAQALMQAGARISELHQLMIPHTSPDMFLVWGELLSQMHRSPHGDALWFVCSTELLARYHQSSLALIGFIGMVASTITVDTVILFYEEEGISKASLRSKKRNVQQLAKSFGGGGHRNASGVSSTRSLAELVADITNALLSESR